MRKLISGLTAVLLVSSLFLMSANAATGTQDKKATTEASKPASTGTSHAACAKMTEGNGTQAAACDPAKCKEKGCDPAKCKEKQGTASSEGKKCEMSSCCKGSGKK